VDPFFLSEEVLAAVAANPEAPLCVACSGGSDSVALLHLLWDRPDLRPRLRVLHYDHGVRPVTSRRDCTFVRDLATRLGLPCRWERRDGRGNGASEDELRRFRMAFFRRAMAAAATPYLLTAHQRDDALETLLLRLSRGSGLAGLVAPRAVQRFSDGSVHLRPLLKVTKVELIQYLRGREICWFEDESNALPVHVRNRVRNELLPLWRSFEPLRDLDQSLARCRELLLEDGDALEQLGEEFYRAALDGAALLLPPLRSAPRALQRRVLHTFFLGHGHVLARPQADALLAALGKKFHLCLGPALRCASDGARIAILSAAGAA
jgi:tRNA(Ile)-lysidine synthase